MIPTPIVQIERNSVAVDADAMTLEWMRREFAKERCLLLRGFFSGDLLEMIWRRLRDAPFKERIARRVSPPAVDLKLADANLVGLLHFLLNDRAVIDFARQVSGNPDATGFVGSVYRLVPGKDHRDSWHDDVDGNRLAALTINLSQEEFEGGELEMRQNGGGEAQWRIANTGPGDGLLFAIAPGLQHRIRPVVGTTPKTALAGWFCRDADLHL